MMGRLHPFDDYVRQHRVVWVVVDSVPELSEF